MRDLGSWKCMGTICKKGKCDKCRRSVEIDGEVTVLFACKTTKCGECTCNDETSSINPSEMSTPRIYRSRQVKSSRMSAGSASSNFNSLLSPPSTCRILREPFEEDAVYDSIVEQALSGIYAEQHIALADRMAFLDDLGKVFGKHKAISDALNHCSKKRLLDLKNCAASKVISYFLRMPIQYLIEYILLNDVIKKFIQTKF